MIRLAIGFAWRLRTSIPRTSDGRIVLSRDNDGRYHRIGGRYICCRPLQATFVPQSRSELVHLVADEIVLTLAGRPWLGPDPMSLFAHPLCPVTWAFGARQSMTAFFSCALHSCYICSATSCVSTCVRLDDDTEGAMLVESQIQDVPSARPTYSRLLQLCSAIHRMDQLARQYWRVYR